MKRELKTSYSFIAVLLWSFDVDVVFGWRNARIADLRKFECFELGLGPDLARTAPVTSMCRRVTERAQDNYPSVALEEPSIVLRYEAAS